MFKLSFSCFQLLYSLIVILIIALIIKKYDKSKLKYEYGLDIKELEKRTNSDYLSNIILLSPNSKEYLSLSEGDKIALKHLVKSGAILEKIQLRIDSIHNIPFLEFLEDEIKNSKKEAILTKILFDAQKGINAIDRLSNKINLAKGIQEYPGKGLYPEDLSIEEFHTIIKAMINEGKIDCVKQILNQRTIVIRDGKYLKGIDYIDFFKEDFEKMSIELEAAAKVSTNKDFNEYLLLQSKALKKADPLLDAYADKKWAELQFTPLEYTITRENYHDEMTGSILENEELNTLLKKYNIIPIQKDYLGVRVGIINTKGTEDILSIKKYLPILSENMPYNNEYEQTISSDKDIKQTMVDVDLVMAAGDVGSYRAGITLAENLPNDDKLSLTIGGGRRNVFHRQIRFIHDIKKYQLRLDTILDKEQHIYYDSEADHWFTIGHENTHSLGPKKIENKLGKYSHIIEENKADMGGLAFLNILVEKGMYTQEQKDKIIVTFITDNFLKTKPNLNQAHRVRTVMQNYYLFKRGAYTLTKDNKIHVNIDKVIPAAQEMLKEIIRIQLDDNFEKAEEYITNNFIWNENMEIIGQKLQKIDLVLNGKLESKLADKLLEE